MALWICCCQVHKGDPGSIYSDDERALRGITRLPTSVTEGLTFLKNDRVLCDQLGPDRLRAFAAVRICEDSVSFEEQVSLLVSRY